MKSIKVQQVVLQICLLGSMLAWQNCSDVNFSKIEKSVYNCDVQLVDGCVIDGFRVDYENRASSFTQPDVNSVDQKLDIMIVTDTSGSMNDEREALANGVQNFISDRFQDVKIGVMLSHADSQYSGAAYRRFNADPILSYNANDGIPAATAIAAIQSQIDDRLNNVESEGVTDGGEAGLYSLYKSLEPNRLATLKNQGFYRDDAALVVIFLSDENDICSYGYTPPGIVPKPDRQNDEIPAFSDFCADPFGNRLISPLSVLSGLKALKGSLPVIVSGAHYLNPSIAPSDGENEVGYGYLEMIGLANGIAESSIHNDPRLSSLAVEIAPEYPDEDIPAKIANGLSFIGQQVAQEIELRTRFTINLNPGEIYVPGSAIVTVDGIQVPSSHIGGVEGTFVDIVIAREDAGRANSIIEISYQLGIQTEVDVEEKLAQSGE